MGCERLSLWNNSISKVFLMEKHYSQMKDSSLWTNYPAPLNTKIKIPDGVSQGSLIHFGYALGSLLKALVIVHGVH